MTYLINFEEVISYRLQYFQYDLNEPYYMPYLELNPHYICRSSLKSWDKICLYRISIKTTFQTHVEETVSDVEVTEITQYKQIIFSVSTIYFHVKLYENKQSKYPLWIITKTEWSSSVVTPKK